MNGVIAKPWTRICPASPGALIPARTLSDGTEVHWLAFVRKRRRETAPVTGLAFGFEVEFEKPVPGPVAVGYGADFGLGLFAPLQRS